ncbi:MAG: thiamine diphosphokinase [Syntrophomonadaceae bacterium]
MRCIILANGEYGEMDAYKDIFENSDTILCADGGANYAFRLGIIPDSVIGDLDSVRPEVRKYFTAQGVEFIQYPVRKDLTDLQLAMDLARERGADQMVLLGALGKRLDHTLHNLYAGIELVRQGVRLSHYTPECRVYLVGDELVIEGTAGDIVSLIALTDRVEGASVDGFEYSLKEPVLLSDKPYAVSNVLAGPRGVIRLRSGILAVFHYF